MVGISTRSMTEQDWAQIKYFDKSEFKAPAKMGYEFMLWLDNVRARAGVPIGITSSYRSPEYNKGVGGAKDSAHTDDICNAVDIGKDPTPGDPHWNRARFAIVFAAYDLGCRRFGTYPGGSLHLDRTESTRPSHCMWNAVDNKA